MRIQIQARAIARRLGFTRLYWRVKGGRDESAFEAAIESAVRLGDVVWDVGANVGHYALFCSSRVGQSGGVVAFEPAPQTFARLTEATAACPNVTLLNVALGAVRERVEMSTESDPAAGTHSLVSGDGTQTVQVEVVPGDEVAPEIPRPTVIKIDVEGYEYEVIQGLSATLAAPTCRGVFCEVHFGLLAARGAKNYPEFIERDLRQHGFATDWVDASHLVAKRSQ